MTTKEETLRYGLSFPDTYQDAPFHDENWQLIRVKGSKKAFMLVYDRNEADSIFSNDTTVPVEIVTEYDELTKTKKQVAREKDVKIITAFDTDYFVGQLL